MKKTLIHIHHTIWITFIFFLMLGALLISAARLATPWLVQQKPLIEKWASAALDQPVQINQLAINWQGFEPVLRCNDVIILNDKRTRPLLRVHELDIGVSLLRSIFSGSFRLGHLRINGLYVKIYQDKDGRIHIRGINTPLASKDVTAQDNSDTLNEIITWLLAEPEISLQNVSLRWYDKNSKLLPVKGLEFNIKNSGERHTIWGQAKLAQTVASQVKFTIKLKGDWQNQNDLKADVYLKAQDILLEQWAERVNLPAINVKKGLADLELWGKWQNKHWQSIQSIFSLDNLAFTYNSLPDATTAATAETKVPISLALKQLSGDISWQPMANGGWQIIANQMRLTLNEHPWQENQIVLTVNPDLTNQNWQFSFINLNELIPLLLKTKLLSNDWQTTLQQLQPKGILRNAQFNYQSAAVNAPATYSFTTQFEQLALNHWHNIPGFTNLAGQLQIIPNGGKLQLKSQQTQFDFGKLFRAPIRLSAVNAQVDWQKNDNGLVVKANNVIAKNEDANINAQVYLFLPADKSSPYLSLLAGYQFFGAQHIGNYLPLTELSPDLVKWLNNAVVRFAHAQGTLVINGDMKDYPFDDNNGTFIIDSQIDDADLNYWPKWPLLKHFSGELLFVGPSMQAFVQSGQVFSSQVKGVTATIPSLKKGVPSTLQIDGQLVGNLNDALRFLRESPLHQIVKNGVDNMAAQGPLQLQLGLTIPLEKNDPIKVNGQIDTQNATLSLPKWNLQFPNFQGRLLFTENGLNANNLTATLWQKPVPIQISTTDKQGMQIQLAGQVASKDIQQQFNANFLNSISGTGNYTVTLHVARKDGQDDLQIQSDLKGVAIDLPAPLTKTADQTRPFKFIANLNGANPFSIFNLSYGDLTAKIAKRPNSWTINLQNSMAKGSIIFPLAKNAVIQADFQRLYLTSSNKDSGSSLQPKDVPNLYFTCQDFRYGNKAFGAVSINLKNSADGVFINQLQAISPNFKLMASGTWRGSESKDWTQLTGTLTSPNIAAALANWDLAIPGFTTKDSQVNFALQWPGAPYAPSLATLKGNLALNLKDGQLSEVGSNSQVKMNFGRIITFMSWQSIARRVHLDFSDLTQHGYSFNILKGDFSLANGNAVTKNTYLDGPMAKVTVNGRIGLAAEDFDMQLGVTTHLSTSLSLLAGLAGGPVVGLATGAASWIANKVFSNEVNKIVTDHYQLKGPWNNPQVTEIKQKMSFFNKAAGQKL